MVQYHSNGQNNLFQVLICGILHLWFVNWNQVRFRNERYVIPGIAMPIKMKKYILFLKLTQNLSFQKFQNFFIYHFSGQLKRYITLFWVNWLKSYKLSKSTGWPRGAWPPDFLRLNWQDLTKCSSWLGSLSAGPQIFGPSTATESKVSKTSVLSTL